jgi:MFS family permease
MLAAMILSGNVRMWMVYVLALSFGIVSGFFLPAAETALPRLVGKEQLEGGNALMMGATQLAGFVGPAAAGSLIALLAHAGSLSGVGIAMAIDAASFAVSAATLLLMCRLPAIAGGADQHPLRAVLDGLRFSASQSIFRWLFGMITVANLLLMGPLMVGIPVLARTRFPEGAAAYGFILSAYAIGNVGGYLGAGALPRPKSSLFTTVVVGLFLMFGAVIGSMAFITSTWLAVALMVVLGLGNGYIAVIAISSLQRLTPEAMLGRVMSLLMLASVGLAPLSQAVAGAVIRLGATALFVPAGAGMALTGVLAALRHRSWSLERFDSIPAEVAAEPA